MPGTKVAIAGATGNIGTPILNRLLKADFEITVLTRKGGNSSKVPKSSNITIKEVDYTSVESLTSALQGVEVVISTVGTELLGGQKPLIDAAVAAGVKRFIPSEFGSNLGNPKTAALPTFAPKIATQKHLQELAAANPSFTYTLIFNGAFLDWGLQVGFVANVKEHTATLYNGGDRPFSATTLGSVADAVFGVIENQPATANRAVYIHDVVTTQNKLIGYAKEKDGKDWTVTNVDTEKTRQSGLAALQSGKAENLGAIFVGFIFSAIFQEGYGGDFSSFVNNDLVGLKGLSEGELKKLVQSYL